MVKVFIIPLVLLALFLKGQTVCAKPMLKLKREIISIEMEELSDRVILNIDSKMSLENTGDEPILLLIASYPESSPYAPENGLPFLEICNKVSGILETEKSEKVLVSRCALPPAEKTPSWQKLRKELDKESPPPNLIKTIGVGEKFEFRILGAVVFWKERYTFSSFADEAIWSEIKTAKSLLLQTTYRIWSLELEPRYRGEITFGKKLQKRWRKYGYLWLDDIVSEPVPLDLSSVVIKTDSQL